MSQTSANDRARGGAPDPSDVFGANEWLVDEMYEQFLADKNEVDPQWWPYFEAKSNGSDSSGAGHAAEQTQAADNNRGSRGNDASGGASKKPSTQPVSSSQQTPPAQYQSGMADSPEDVRELGEEQGVDAPHIRAVQPLQDDDAEERETAPLRTKSLSEALDSEIPKTQVDHHTPEEAAIRPSERAKNARTEDGSAKLRGYAARVVQNMESSLEVPTATSVRAIPAKVIVDNRIVINNQLRRSKGGKVSFTHLIGYAIVEALAEMPAMNVVYSEVDGKPAMQMPVDINMGIAIDVAKDDGTRQLMVPAVKGCQEYDFKGFWEAYEAIIKKTRAGKLEISDFQGITLSLTNVGGIGTVHSVPRLMQGQGVIVGVGAMEYPAEYQGASAETLARLAISKVMTLTSTYDHRIIQGAQSGEFLRLIHTKLLGLDGFYDRVFRSLRIPYEPIRWIEDISVTHDDEINKTARVVELIQAYRVRGHLMADIDPLEYKQRRHPDLDVHTHGLTLWDLEREFATEGFGSENRMLLRRILGVLRDSYCRTVGIEYMHIQDPEQRKWIQECVERPWESPSRDEQLRILHRLNAAEAFETFLQTKFVGQKRFSLEGGESVVPLMDALLSSAATAGLEEVCIGMPHRGRLNMLANIAGKSYGQIFREFEGTQDPRSVQGSGDVKYHLGTEGLYTAESGEQTRVYLAANPSHLEAVNPVLEGIVRAKQDRMNMAGESFPVLPVLLHGDAAFAGQGVVAETLNLSQLRGYRTGGTIHIVINNQIGFTTAPSASRSSVYCTDVGKMIQAPIFHVNGDDPEACARVARIAFDYRQKFDRDVIIDMVCYRRRGHNEGDDPSMTQPMMYSLIEGKRSVRKLYTEALAGRGDITEDEALEALADYQKQLERVFAETRQATSEDRSDSALPRGLEKPMSQQDDDAFREVGDTSVPAGILERIGKVHASPPEGFEVHPKLMQMLNKREQMSREGKIDWGFGEILAFGSLLMEGVPVRLSGQDSRRGTFVQRHAVLTDKSTGDEWTPLLYLGKGQARFFPYDSLLSEYAAMGFEYGYSVERPDAMVLWEAQFGDFVNGAQTIVDEFISSSEQKWGQRSSVTLLLPHGYEGQGPDHSSARIERFLTICAETNMTVAQPTTPASYFHLLRRQAFARPRRPLIVFTPKSMLRMKAATSSVEDFTSGGFKPIIGDTQVSSGSVNRVLLCSGKVYWDLVAKRDKAGDDATAIVRMEQIYPVDVDGLEEALAPYGDAELVWVQDEPANQGPWPFVGLHLPDLLGRKVRRVSRPAAASPATGSAKMHKAEQEALIDEAFER